jgi:hypothetical protein
LQQSNPFLHLHPNNCTSCVYVFFLTESARSFIIGLLLRDIGFFRFSVLSATEMRRALCAAIMQAPMMFFMTENLGPLTGVFTRDLSIVSEERAYFACAPCVLFLTL